MAQCCTEMIRTYHLPDNERIRYVLRHCRRIKEMDKPVDQGSGGQSKAVGKRANFVEPKKIQSFLLNIKIYTNFNDDNL